MRLLRITYGNFVLFNYQNSINLFMEMCQRKNVNVYIIFTLDATHITIIRVSF
jgi:hypothetical protein